MSPTAAAPVESAVLLAGLRILELGPSPAVAFCGRVLADLGANVTAARSRPDQPGGASQRSASMRSMYLDAGKRNEPLLVDHRLIELLAETDVVVTDRHVNDLPEQTANERLIVVSVRPFGSTGPHARHHAQHLTIFHASGEGSTLPSGRSHEQFPHRAPVQLGSEMGFADAGWNAAVATLAAVLDRMRTGSAHTVDVSVQESILTLNRTRMNRFNNEGVNVGRQRNRYGIAGMLQCADGWAQVVGLRDDHWDRLVAQPQGEAFRLAGFGSAEARAADTPRLGDVLAAWCAERPKAQVAQLLTDIGAPAGIVAGPEDLLASGQLAHRGFFRTVSDGRGGKMPVPGPPYRLSGPVRPSAAPAPSRSRPGRMLEGIRVLDFTWAAAGPYATLLLGLLGADVVKVESARRLDPARSGFLDRYDGVDASPIFNELSLNKRSLQVDLTQAEGLEVVRRLVAQADIVVDNFRPGVMARFDMAASDLLDRHPHLIVASSSANGSTGPDAMSAGLASIFAASGGLSEQTGYADGLPTEVGDPVDYRSGAALTAGILAALHHRQRTGIGQHVDLSSREVVIASAPDALLAHVLGVPWQPRRGNEHPDLAPHDVYPSADGQWLAVAVSSEDEHEALRQALAGTGTIASDDLGAALAAWANARVASDAARLLQEHGVAASPVMAFSALAQDPHLRSRAMFVDVEHPLLGMQRVMRGPWTFSGWDAGSPRPGPMLGADNAAILATLPDLVELTPERAAEVFR